MCVFFLDLSSEFPSFNLILPGTIYYSMQLVITTRVLYSMHHEHFDHKSVRHMVINVGLMTIIISNKI